MPIDHYMRGNITLLVSHFPSILLQFIEYLTIVGINNAIKAKNSPAFVFNNKKITVYFYAALRTTCIGKLCDRKRVNNWENIKGCGCHSMLTWKSNTASMFHP